MSWQIPTQIEQDIISGKAQYRTFQTGVGGQSILPVPSNAYAVIFGYDFSPAGGGLVQATATITQGTSAATLSPNNTRWFETQQISFYTGTDFYPFIHHIDNKTTPYIFTVDPVTGTATFVRGITEIDNTPIARQVYITSSKDITISVGLVLNSPVASANNIPITNRTPELLTYGGAVQAVPTQTDFGPAATPIQFMQPSPKDFQDFGFGVLPNGASGQAFATPDLTNGLLDPNLFLSTLGVTFQNAAAANYFLCLHYALYTETVPEQRG
jgi:hypothetical protein